METESKRRTVGIQKKTTKICLRCGKQKQLTQFFANRDWTQQLGKDCWCKTCAMKAMTKQELKQYFWQNNRVWTDDVWKQAQKKALQTLSTNTVYIKSNESRRLAMLQQLTCQNSFNVQVHYYKYIDNKKTGKTFEQAKQSGDVLVQIDQDQKKWSSEWNGNFSARQLQYLNSYYKRLGADTFVEQIDRDYARKISIHSMLYNKALNDFSMGKCDYAHVKDTQSAFDTMCKSANLAACKRKDVQVTGTTSFSELFMDVEKRQDWKPRKIEWQPDDVDKCINSLSFIIQSLQLDKQ